MYCNIDVLTLRFKIAKKEKQTNQINSKLPNK